MSIRSPRSRIASPSSSSSAGADVESLAKRHDRLRPLIEPAGDDQHLAADLRDLFAELEHPLELVGEYLGQPRDRTHVIQKAAEDRLWRLDGETEDAHVRSPGGTAELRGKDSNLEFQGQNLASCRLLHPAVD